MLMLAQRGGESRLPGTPRRASERRLNPAACTAAPGGARRGHGNWNWVPIQEYFSFKSSSEGETAPEPDKEVKSNLSG